MLALALPPLMGQAPDRTAGKDEFPALQLLPPGSEVRGISLPRYENHRVSALIMAEVLRVMTRHTVTMEGIRTRLYNPAGETTSLEMKDASYDFRTGIITSDSPVRAQGPQFSAQGSSLIFNNSKQQGLLKGPVHTTLNTSALSTPGAPSS